MSDVSGDLSRFHQPILKDFFEYPKTPQEWEKYKLSDEQIQFFRDNGYLTGVRVLSDEQVAKLLEALPSTTDPNNESHKYYYEFRQNESLDPNKTVFHSLGAWRVNSYFHDLLWSPAFQMAAYQLLGGDYRLFLDQLFCKPAKCGGNVAWHQDWLYWTWSMPVQHLTAWMPLDGSTLDNGCLWYVPKSHNWGLIESTGTQGDMVHIDNDLTTEQKKDFEKRVPILLKPGECSFHHPFTLHGSYGNTTDFTRRAAVINICKDGTISNYEGLLKELPTEEARVRFNKFGGCDWKWIQQGKLLDGPFHPLLFDSKKALGQSQ